MLSAIWTNGGDDVSQVIGDQIEVDSILRGFGNINTKSNNYQNPQPINQYNKNY